MYWMIVYFTTKPKEKHQNKIPVGTYYGFSNFNDSYVLPILTDNFRLLYNGNAQKN